MLEAQPLPGSRSVNANRRELSRFDPSCGDIVETDERWLTLKERRFVDAYLGSAAGNGTEAVLQAKGTEVMSEGDLRVDA